MELRNLRHVVALARTLNYVRAGEELGLSQSALTRSIQAIERQTGVRLFDRDRGGVHLTRQGRIFVDRATIILADADALHASMQQAANGEEGEVPFGIEPLPARVLLPAILSQSLDQSPGLRNRVLIRSIEALWSLLIAGDIDFFISAEGRVPDHPPTRIASLGSFPLSLLVRAGHPALNRTYAARPYPVLLAGDAGQFEHLPQTLRDLIAGPRHIVEDYDLLAKLTETSDAILIASSFAVQQEIAEGRIHEILPPDDYMPARIRIVMYSLERRSLPPAAQKLKHAFQRQMQLLAQR